MTRFRCLPLACELEQRVCVQRQRAARAAQRIVGSLATANHQFATCLRCEQGEGVATELGVTLLEATGPEWRCTDPDPDARPKCAQPGCTRLRSHYSRKAPAEQADWCKQCRQTAQRARTA